MRKHPHLRRIVGAAPRPISIFLTAALIAACGGTDTARTPTAVTINPTTTTAVPTTTGATTTTTVTTTTTTAATLESVDLQAELETVAGDLSDRTSYQIGYLDNTPFAAVHHWSEHAVSIWVRDTTWSKTSQIELGEAHESLAGPDPGRTWISLVDATGEGTDDIVVWYWGPRRALGTIITSANGSWESIGGGSQLMIAGPGLVSIIGNDCAPSCAEGNTIVSYYAWATNEFVACSELDDDQQRDLCVLTPG